MRNAERKIEAAYVTLSRAARGRPNRSATKLAKKVLRELSEVPSLSRPWMWTVACETCLQFGHTEAECEREGK